MKNTPVIRKSETLEDIVFDGRNKSYGAFDTESETKEIFGSRLPGFLYWRYYSCGSAFYQLIKRKRRQDRSLYRSRT